MKYKEGDIVKIKSWEQMEKEYGLDDSGDINCLGRFTGGMKKYCEGEYRVDAVTHGSCGDYYLLRGCWEYAFTDEMIACKVDENEVSGAGGGDAYSDTEDTDWMILENPRMDLHTEENPIARIEKILEILKDRVASVVVSVESIQIYTDLFYKSIDSYDEDDSAQEE